MDGVQRSNAGPRPMVLGKAEAALELDTTLYHREAVLRTAYKLGDRMHAQLAPGEGKNSLRVTLSIKTGDLEEGVGAFLDELVDQQLRHVLEREMGPLRELIVAQAFAEGDLLWPMEEEPTAEGSTS